LIVGLPLNGGPGGKGGDASGGGLYFYIGCPASSGCEGIVHSTVSRNVCWPGLGGVGGAGINGGSPGATGATGAARGCGLYDNPNTVPELQIGNTIVAANYAFPLNLIPQGPDVFGPVVSSGYNLIGALDANSSGWMSGAELSGTLASPLKPGLGPIQNNGGETPTMVPLAGSPAIDAGTVGCASLDQNGKPRPITITGAPASGSDGSDIGACELQAPAMKALAILSMQSFDADLIVSWPASLEDYVLQESSELGRPIWTDVSRATNVVGDDYVVFIQSPAGNKFFQLVQRQR
jgi:hypothetical protein